MAFRHGKSTKVLFGKFNMSAFLNESSVSESVEVAESTTYGKSAKTYIVGLADATVSLSGMFDGDTNASDDVFDTALGDDLGRVITIAPEGLAVGRRVRICTAKSTSYESSSPVGDVVSVSCEVQSDGGVDAAISLIDLAAVSATANGTSQDGTASSTNGGSANLHVTENTRNGNTTIKVQHSADNSTWADLINFAVVGSATTTAERLVVTGTVNRYVRIQHTLAGSTGTITYQSSFARK